jgi:hypothetical protein
MIIEKHYVQGFLAGALLLAAGGASAVTTTYNFSITGVVDVLGTKVVTVKNSNGSTDSVTTTTQTNAYNLAVNDTITAYGTFTADLGVNETGTVLFDQASGNTLTIDMNGALPGGTLLFASDAANYVSGGAPSLTFSNGALVDFDFLKISTPKFNSSFTYFDDLTSVAATPYENIGGGKSSSTTYNAMLGHWLSGANEVAISPVPEAETYAMMLVGLGLVGLMGATRKKSLQATA